MSSSLEECEKKLNGFEIQEDYHAADLRKARYIIKSSSLILSKVSFFYYVLGTFSNETYFDGRTSQIIWRKSKAF